MKYTGSIVNYCLSSTICGIGQSIKSLEAYVCPNEYLSLSIATAVFVQSSSNLKRRSHIWQRRASSMANNTGTNKRACASIYFRFSSLSACTLWKHSFNVKYLENGDRYHDGVNGSRIWNRPCTSDWHHDLWPWMTLNSPSSRSSKLHVKDLIMMTDADSIGQITSSLERYVVQYLNFAFQHVLYLYRRFGTL